MQIARAFAQHAMTADLHKELQGSASTCPPHGQGEAVDRKAHTHRRGGGKILLRRLPCMELFAICNPDAETSAERRRLVLTGCGSDRAR